MKPKLMLTLLLLSILALPNVVLAQAKKPNILVIFGDDIGQTNISAYSFGLMGYKTPNIDRIAKEGMMFTDYYAEQSCTAGRSSFITGQCTLRTGLSSIDQIVEKMQRSFSASGD
jgi:arylsulfatase A-like enzyme